MPANSVYDRSTGAIRELDQSGDLRVPTVWRTLRESGVMTGTVLSETGSLSVAAARKAALASTDLQVGRFLDHLRATGRWSSPVVMVLADHSMHWSLPQRVVSLTPAPDGGFDGTARTDAFTTVAART